MSAGAARAVLLLALALGAGVRLLDVDRPADWRTLNAWRESDYAQISRNFLREGMNPLRPRVDWRGDTSGEVQSELPVVPWLAAALWRAFGPREAFLRVVACAASLAGLLAFARLARDALGPTGAAVAVAVFAAHGMLVYLATAIQPEPVLLLCSILALHAAWRYVRARDAGEAGGRALLAAGLFTGLAILAKGSAAHLGLVLAWAVLRDGGARAVGRPVVWAAAALALVPGLLWYAASLRIYHETGLSLGIANETHALSLDVLRSPRSFVVGNAVAEVRDVLGVFGLPLAALAVWRGGPGATLPAVWYGAALVFYVAAGDTSGDGWAWYYHALSIAPACLLIGCGAALGLGSPRPAVRRAAMAAAILTVVVQGARGAQLLHRRDHHAAREATWRCLRELAPAVPADARILVRGGVRRDHHGHPVAWNASEAFQWMDRRGWNYAVEDFSLDHVASFAARGAYYWVAKPVDLEDPAVRDEADRRFEPVARCDGYALYALREGGPAAAPPAGTRR